MNNFQLRRFGLVLRRDLIENRKRHLQFLAAFFIVCLLINCGLLYSPCKYGLTDAPSAHATQLLNLKTSVCHATLTCFAITLFIGISDTFRCLRTKQESINYLMLPATAMEKFVSRFLIFTVLWTAGFAVAAFLADCARMLLFAPLQTHVGCTFTAMPAMLEWTFDQFNPFAKGLQDTELILVVFLLDAFILWLHSVYLLGSSIFRKHPVVLTTLSLIVCGCALAYAVSFVPFPSRSDISEQLAKNLTGLAAAAFFLAMLLNYRLAYRNFRRCPVIGGKWFHF